MIPAPFDYVRAGSADEALALLAEHGDEAKLLAGGQSLLPLMKLRLAVPSVVVDAARASDLVYIRDEGAEIAICPSQRSAGMLIPSACDGRCYSGFRPI